MMHFSWIKRLLISLLFISSTVSAAEPLDINTATVQELAAVMSGIGEAKAEAIVAYRAEHGSFDSIDDLIKVKGVGASLLERNRTFIQVKLAD